MHVEIEVALNFIISYLYNKLPRRRVNIFGEELEKALKHKFQGHWYPDKPVKGSAFRCFKTGDTPDPVLEIAAVQSGVLSTDILENLPHELSVWIDPGEVSYRIGEKGVIKILYSAANSAPIHDEYSNASVAAAALEQEVSRKFNPEAQCFKPMESLSAAFVNMSLAMDNNNSAKFKGQPLIMGSGSDSGEDRHSSSDNSEDNLSDNCRHSNYLNEGYLLDNGHQQQQQQQQQQNSAASFLQRQQPPSTFTIASFAATKFGSTKLKTSSKRNNRQFSSRMSPVEFQNYMKQRSSLQQPPFMQSPNAMMGHSLKPLMSPSRSISPGNHTAPALSINSDPFYFHNNGYYGQQQQQQPYLGSHHQLGYGGSAAALNNASMANSTSSSNVISSSVSSISSASSSSASSSVSSSSLGDHLLFGGQFGASAANNRLSGQMYNFYAANEAPFLDNGFFAPLGASAGLGNQFEDADLGLEANASTKFGVIGGGLSGHVGAQQEQATDSAGATGIEGNGNANSGADSSENASSPNSSSNSLENLQANNFYSGSSGSPFPQLLVAN